MPGKKVHERRSALRPSEKELLERRSGAKISLTVTIRSVDRRFKALSDPK
jgi:hypothetical protein